MDEQFIRDRITELHMAADKSEREMSLDLGHSASYINSIASGRITPSLREFLYICEYLNVTPEMFFKKSKELTPNIIKLMSLISELDDEDLELIFILVKRLNSIKQQKSCSDS